MRASDTSMEILPEEYEKVTTALGVVADKKAIEPLLFDVTARQTFTDYILICHGSSDRHVQAIYETVEESLKKKGIRPIGIEGENLCQWVLMDYGGLIVNVFYEPLRGFYDLEGLWTGCPVIEPGQPVSVTGDSGTSPLAKDNW